MWINEQPPSGSWPGPTGVESRTVSILHHESLNGQAKALVPYADRKTAYYADRSSPPTPLVRFNGKQIPAELKAKPQWVGWKSRWKETEQKWTKLPLDPKTGFRQAAKSNDPTTWASIEQLRASLNLNSGRVDGVGFVFAAGGGIVGLDLDGARHPETGELSELARLILGRLPTYAEVSPSATGIKLFARGALPWKGKKNEAHGLELYGSHRYFTVTGCRLEDSPAELRDCQAGIDWLLTEFFPQALGGGSLPTIQRTSRPLTDDEVIEWITRRAKNSGRTAPLWAGDTSAHSGNHSAADQALCNALAFWCGKDAAQMDRVFRRSGLMRSKWDEMRGDRTYGEITLAEAISVTSEVFGQRNGRSGQATSPNADAEDDGPPPPEQDTDPHRLARLFLERHRHPDGLTLRYYRGEFIRWNRAAYEQVPDRDLQAQVTAFVRRQLERDTLARVAAYYAEQKRTEAAGEAEGKKAPAKDEVPTVPRVTRSLIGDVVQALAGMCLIPSAVQAPAWIGGDGPQPAELIVTPNAVVHLPSFADGRPGAVLTPTPRLLTFERLDFDFDPDAPAPSEWLKFLADVWTGDPESIDTFQEWCGYTITPDTSLQKILLAVGPPRAGKGTSMKVNRWLVGERNVASPTLTELTQRFALSGLLHKSLAVIADARLSGRTDTTPAVERLLSISGEDAVDVDRKGLPIVNARLGVRFAIVTNELPNLKDVSGALVSRMIVLRYTRTFLGREDHGLEARLRGELPGILVWAIAGWKRLRDRGRFQQPASGAELVQELEALGSPVTAFLREKCRVGATYEVEVRDLYRTWRSWCEQVGRREPGSEQVFGRDVRAAVPGVDVSRPRIGGQRVRVYRGIGLRDVWDAEDDDRSATGPQSVRDDDPTNLPENQGLVRGGPHGPHSSLLTGDEREKKGGDDIGDIVGSHTRSDRGPRGPQPGQLSEDLTV